MARQLLLGQYPYTYLRTIMMKRSLLSKGDFDKLLKLSADEISAYLQELEYKKEIDELAVEYSGHELLERALTLNLGRTFSKLLQISPFDLRVLLSTYLKRYDYENAKIILRGKHNGLSTDDIKKSLTALGVTTPGLPDVLLNQKTPEDVLNTLPLLSEQQRKQAGDHYTTTKNLSASENIIDKAYFQMATSQLRMIWNEGKLFKKFLLFEIDAFVIKMIVQLKSEEVDESTIKELMLRGSLSQELYDKIIRMSPTDIKKELEKTPFAAVFESLPDNFTLTQLDRALDKYVMNQSTKLITQHPMSCDVILGYAFLKQAEVRSLLRLIKAKSLGLSQELIEELIVV